MEDNKEEILEEVPVVSDVTVEVAEGDVWPDPGKGGDYADYTDMIPEPMEEPEEEEGGCDCDCAACANCEMREKCKHKEDVIVETTYEVLSSGFADAEEIIEASVIGGSSVGEIEFTTSNIVENFMEDQLVLDSRLVERSSEGKWKICIIREGWSLNKKYYPREVLERDKDKFEGVKIAVYGYFPENGNLGHVPNSIRRNVPEGLVLNDVGWVENVRTEIENGRLQLVGDFICTDENLDSKLNRINTLRSDRMPGFSIDAMGEVTMGMAEGRQGLIVKAITHGNEVTLVDRPAAGGKFQQRLVASLDDLGIDLETNLEKSKEEKEKKMDEKDNVQENALLDGLNAQLEALKALVEKSNADAEVARKEMEDAKKSARLAECKSLLSMRLRESNLNDVACAMIRRDFIDKEFTEEELDKRISDVRELMASLNGGGVAQVAQPRVSKVVESRDRLVAELELCWGLNTKKLSESEQEKYRGINPSFLHVYKNWFDDPELTWQAGPSAIQEATVTSDLPSVMGNTLHRTVVMDYNEQPQLWRALFNVDTNIRDLKANRKVYLSEISGGNTVSEGSDYLEMSALKDEYLEYTVAKRGGIYTLTWESLVNDDLGAMQKLAKKISRNAAKDLNEFAFGIVMANQGAGGVGTDNSYDGVDFFHANHFNLGSTALSHTSLNAAVVALSNQYAYGARTTVTDNPLSSGATTINLTSTTGLKAGQFIVIEAEKIKVGTVASATQLTGCTRGVGGTAAAAHVQTTRVDHMHMPLNLMNYYLLYPPDLQDTVDRLFGSELVPGVANNDKNRFRALNSAGVIIPQMVPSNYLGGDVNNWYLVARPEDIDTYYMGFFENKQDPEVWYADNMLVDPTFLADKFRYKYRHIYGGTVFDWRGAYAAVVS